jgi:hypothetical protein
MDNGEYNQAKSHVFVASGLMGCVEGLAYGIRLHVVATYVTHAVHCTEV